MGFLSWGPPPQACRLSVWEDAYLPKELRTWGLRLGLLPACIWIQDTAFLSRSSHSHCMFLALVCSHNTASTVAQPEEFPFCATDRNLPETFKFAGNPSRECKKPHPSSLTMPQPAVKWGNLVSTLFMTFEAHCQVPKPQDNHLLSLRVERAYILNPV